MTWTGIHFAFVDETFFKTNNSVIATKRAFCIYFILGKDVVLDRIFNPWLYQFSIQNSIIFMEHEISMKNSLCSNCRFTSLKKCLNGKCIVCTGPSYDYN